MPQPNSRSNDVQSSEFSSHSTTPVSSPMTPRRQSARLQAKTQSPLLVDESGRCESEQTFNRGDELGIMQQPVCDCEHQQNEPQAASPSKVEWEESNEEGHSRSQLQIAIEAGADQSSSFSMDTSANSNPAQKHDDTQCDLLSGYQSQQEEPGPDNESGLNINESEGSCKLASNRIDVSLEQAAGAEVRLAPEPSRSVLSELPFQCNLESDSSVMQDNTSDPTRDNDENDWDDEDSEEAAVDFELSGASSPAPPLESRVPQSLPRNLHPHRTLQWTPSRTRKVSLRTATLLKRSAQYPFVPLAELKRPNVRSSPSKGSPLGPRTSTGSQDMDITQDFGHNSDVSDVSSGANMDQYSSSDSSESDNEQDQNEQADHALERAPTLAGFLTPQRTKQRTLRRMSNPEAPVTPRLRPRSSWQWLRSFFASPVRDSEEQPQDEPPKSEQDGQTQPTVELIAEDKDEFHDVQENESAVQHSEALAYEAMDIDPESPSARSESRSPDTRPTTSSDTPNLHDLKHMFAMQPNTLSVSPMADFRHFMRPNNNAQEDVSLEAAWNTLTAYEDHEKEDWSDVEEYPSPAFEDHDAAQTNPYISLGNHDQHGISERLDCLSSSPGLQSLLPNDVSHARSVLEGNVDMSGSVHEASSLKLTIQDDATQGIPPSPDTNNDSPAGSVKLRHTEHSNELHIPKSSDSYPTEHSSDKENEPSQTRVRPKTRAMPVASTVPGISVSKGSDNQVPTPRRSPRKNLERERDPLRSSPRLKQAQKQPSQTNNKVTDAKANRMTARPVRQKEPYVPVRRQLPARSSIRQFRMNVDPNADSSSAIGHAKPTKRMLSQGTASNHFDQPHGARGALSSIDDKARQGRAGASQK